jgi:hypothetical protein
MPRKYILGAVLLCIVIGAFVWTLTSLPLPATTSPLVSQAFWRAESPATLAWYYKLLATRAGWELDEGWGLDDQDGNSYSFYSYRQTEGWWPCFTSNSLTITLTPSWGGTLVRMTVTGNGPAQCAAPSP